MEIASTIDHTILKPDCTKADIEQICEDARKHHFKAVCIPPFFIPLATELLKDSSVKIATVIGFPMGYSATSAKVEEIKRAINDGVDEIDVVINICAVKSGNWNYVKSDINSATMAAHLRSRPIKVILETGLLTDDEIERLCKICADEGVEFVKTSTGFNAAGASVEIVQKLRSLLPSTIKIKASGGIRSRKDAEKLIEAGADRLGSSSGVKIVES